MKIDRPFFTGVILMLLFLPDFASAQTDYVIKLNGDTLKGSVKILSSDHIDRVQIMTDGTKSFFTGLQVRSVRKDNHIYRAVRYENTIRFMKVIKDGYLTLHAFTAVGQNSWDGLYLTKLDGTGMEVPNLSFKKIMIKYLSDCPDVTKRITNGDLTKRDMERIVDLYNTCLQTKTEGSKSKPEPQPEAIDSEKVLAVKNLIAKVEAENLLTKKDALDVLKDIQSKVTKNEPIPNYLLEGLKSFLADTPSLTKDLDALLALLKK